jgi:hypothetical protein
MTFEWIRSGQAISCRALVPSSGTRQAGTLRCSFLVPDDALRGTWNVLEILVRDRNANGRFYNLPDLAAAGFSTSFTVIDP